MLNINGFNNITNKNNTQIKDGDIVRYSIMRKLDSNKALINIMDINLLVHQKCSNSNRATLCLRKGSGHIEKSRNTEQPRLCILLPKQGKKNNNMYNGEVTEKSNKA